MCSVCATRSSAAWRRRPRHSHSPLHLHGMHLAKLASLSVFPASVLLLPLALAAALLAEAVKAENARKAFKSSGLKFEIFGLREGYQICRATQAPRDSRVALRRRRGRRPWTEAWTEAAGEAPEAARTEAMPAEPLAVQPAPQSFPVPRKRRLRE